MSELLKRLNLVLKRPFKKKPRLDGAAFRRSRKAWTRAIHDAPDELPKMVEPMTDEEFDHAMNEALQEAEEDVEYEIAAEEEVAEQEAQRTANEASPEQAAGIQEVAAQEKIQRAEAARAKREAAREDAIRQTKTYRDLRREQWENAQAAACVVKAISVDFETVLQAQLERSDGLKKNKAAKSLTKIFETIQEYKTRIERVRVESGLPRESHVQAISDSGEESGDGSDADREPLDGGPTIMSKKQFIAMLTDGLSAAIQGIARAAAVEAKRLELDFQKDFDSLYNMDLASSVQFSSQLVLPESPEFLSSDPYAGQHVAHRSMTPNFARSFERLRSLNASIAEITAAGT
jgi:hypothetical protein